MVRGRTRKQWEGSVDMESSQNGHTAPELPRVCQFTTENS